MREMIFPYKILLIIFVCTDGTIYQPDTKVIAKTGNNVTLKCRIQSISDIDSIFWIRMKQPRNLQFILGTFSFSTDFVQYNGVDEQRFKVRNENENHNLNIHNLQDSDSGIYYCGYILSLVVKFGSGTLLNCEESELKVLESTTADTSTPCEISTQNETKMSSVVGLGVALGVCIAMMAVMAFLIASHFGRPVCQNCKEKAQKQLHCGNSVVQEADAEMHYAAMDFSNRKNKGKKNTELRKEVVYSDVKSRNSRD